MARIDEIKSHIEWLRDLFKILVTILVADIAGVSKLHLDQNITILFYIGIGLIVVISIWLIILSKKIRKNISKLGDL